MADGRQIIEEVNSLVVDLSKRMAEPDFGFPMEAFTEFKRSVESSAKWVALCRRKVWLRSVEGTSLAQGCLDAANRLHAGLGDPPVAGEAAAVLACRLEALAREIENNAQIIT